MLQYGSFETLSLKFRTLAPQAEGWNSRVGRKNPNKQIKHFVTGLQKLIHSLMVLPCQYSSVKAVHIKTINGMMTALLKLLTILKMQINNYIQHAILKIAQIFK